MNTQIGFFVFFFLLNCLGMVIFYLVLKSRFSRDRLLGELRNEVDKLIVDLGREADRDVALLESRIKNLRALIDEADRRTVLADRETVKRQEAARVIASVQTVPIPKIQPVPPTASEQAPLDLPTVSVKSVATETPRNVQREVTQTSEPVTVYTRPTIRRSDTQLEPVVPLNERVLEMIRKGISAEMIASTMSVSLGEVELIIAMNSSSL